MNLWMISFLLIDRWLLNCIFQIDWQELEAAHKAKAELETSMQEELAKKDAIIARLKEIEEVHIVVWYIIEYT